MSFPLFLYLHTEGTLHAVPVETCVTIGTAIAADIPCPIHMLIGNKFSFLVIMLNGSLQMCARYAYRLLQASKISDFPVCGLTVCLTLQYVCIYVCRFPLVALPESSFGNDARRTIYLRCPAFLRAPDTKNGLHHNNSNSGKNRSINSNIDIDHTNTADHSTVHNSESVDAPSSDNPDRAAVDNCKE